MNAIERQKTIAAAFEEWRLANRPEGARLGRDDVMRFLVWLEAKRPRLLSPVPQSDHWRVVDTAVRRYCRLDG